MRVGIDAKFASPHYGGLGTYTVSIIQALVDLGKDEILAFVPDGRLGPYQLPPPSDSFTICSVPVDVQAPEDFSQFRVYWEQTVLPVQLAQQAIDVFFGPVFTAPLAWHGVRVVTVHDLLFERSDQYNTTTSNSYYQDWAKRCAQQADAIITVSRSTAEDVRALWHINDIPITAIHLAPTLSFLSSGRATSRTIMISALGINDPYILYVGSSFPRKNLERLIAAYAALPAALQHAIRLLLVTAQDPNVETLLATYGMSDRATVMGYCDPNFLPHIYAAAEMLVLPSLFEGFGLPAIEAMACGTPVVASTGGAIPEVVGDAALLIDPFDTANITEAIARLLTNDDLRADLIARGRRRACHFQWTKTARSTREVLAGSVAKRGTVVGLHAHAEQSAGEV